MDDIYIAIERLESLLINMLNTRNFTISDDIYKARQRVDDICIDQRYVKVCGCWYRENEFNFYHIWTEQGSEWRLDYEPHVKLALHRLTHGLDMFDFYVYTRKQRKPPVNRTRNPYSYPIPSRSANQFSRV